MNTATTEPAMSTPRRGTESAETAIPAIATSPSAPSTARIGAAGVYRLVIGGPSVNASPIVVTQNASASPKYGLRNHQTVARAHPSATNATSGQPTRGDPGRK